MQKIFKLLSLFQNPMVFPQALGKSGLKPAFSLKSKAEKQHTPISIIIVLGKNSRIWG
jgi:hypothetical protein